MRLLATLLTLLSVAACAGPAARDDAAARRLDAQRELERECRMASREGRDDPRCPRDEQGSRQTRGDPLALPPPPSVPPLPTTD